MNGQKRNTVGARIGKIVAGVFIMAWTLIPLIWAVIVSVSSPVFLKTRPIGLIPTSIEWTNYAKLLSPASTLSAPFLQAMLSSVIQAVGTTVLTLLIALPAGYAFARIPFRGRGIAFGVVTFSMAIPVYLVMIPLFQMAAGINMLNTHTLVIVLMSSAALPMAIWIIRSHVASLPPDLEAAAQIDGAGTGRILVYIILPLVAPGLVAAAVVTFLMCWGSFLLQLIYASAPDVEPLTVLIPTFASKYGSDYGLQAAAGILAVIPPFILVIFLQKYIVSGILQGATK